MSTATAYIGLGANLGDPKSSLTQALKVLKEAAGILDVESSSFFRSDPVDAPGPAYINAVAKVTTTLAPLPLLDVLRTIETNFGRERHFRNAPRTLDLDLLLYDKLEFSTPTLTVPHPRMHLRAFVIMPLLQLAGPQTTLHGESLDRWLAACSDQACTRI
jgi:2-amino-4-hydroxy-6-hydroxymethyldihydropteridine diphosphokinase